MKIIKHDLGGDLDAIRIIPLSDVHIGEHQFNIKKFKEAVEYIETHDDVFTIINGDVINNAIRASVSDIYGETMSPMESMDKAVELLEPIKDKILVFGNGNHEARTYKHTGVDISKHMAWKLGLTDYYAPENYILFVSFGTPFSTRPNRRYTYTIHGTHGVGGGGRTVGSKMNSLERLAGNVNADIYLHSHTHTPATFKLDFLETDSRTKTVRQVTKMFVNTSAWLDYGGYGEVANFKPSTITPVIIKLIPDSTGLHKMAEV